jgi:hypothetical protein
MWKDIDKFLFARVTAGIRLNAEDLVLGTSGFLPDSGHHVSYWFSVGALAACLGVIVVTGVCPTARA